LDLTAQGFFSTGTNSALTGQLGPEYSLIKPLNVGTYGAIGSTLATKLQNIYFDDTQFNTNLITGATSSGSLPPYSTVVSLKTQNYVCNSITQTILAPTSTGEQIFVFSEGVTDLGPSYKNPADISPAPANANYSVVYYNAISTLILASGATLYQHLGNNNWSSFYTFNANINCIVEIGTALYVGGEFMTDIASTTQFNYIASVDNNLSVSPVGWSNRGGDIGFNGIVKTLCRNDTFTNAYLYVGGTFTKTGTSLSYNLNRFGCIDTATLQLYSIDNNSGVITNGFNNTVWTISCSSNRIFIGGEFTFQSASFSGFLNTTSKQRAVVWTSNNYQSTSATEFETVGPSTTSINNTVFTSVKDPSLGIFHFGGEFTDIGGPSGISYLGWCDVLTPASVGFTTFFDEACYSVKEGNGFVFAKKGLGTGSLYAVNQIIILAPSTPNGVMAGCFDVISGLFYFFFSNSNIVTSFNFSTTTTIDLTSLGIGVCSNGTIYENYIELNGLGSFFTGISAVSTSLSTSDIFVITSSYSTNFN
jgi:hypothetical protein